MRIKNIKVRHLVDELSVERTCFSQTVRLTGCNMKKRFSIFVPIKTVLLSRHRVSHYDSSLVDRGLLQSSSKTKISTHFRGTNYFKLGRSFDMSTFDTFRSCKLFFYKSLKGSLSSGSL